MKADSPLQQALYAYVEKENAEYVKTEGKKMFGSTSAFINALIAKERKVTPALGKWQPPGVSLKNKKLRREQNRKRVSKKSKPSHLQLAPELPTSRHSFEGVE